MMRSNTKMIVIAALLICFWINACQQKTLGQDAASSPAQTRQLTNSKPSMNEIDLKLPGIEELSATGRPLSRFVPNSISKAMKFRASLLEGANLDSHAAAIQKLSLTFAEIYKGLDEEQLAHGSPELFDFTDINFESAIRGTTNCPDATSVFGAFTGRWYGRWAEQEVDHHWSHVIKPNEHAFGTAFPDFKIGWQYAWIGDGYGINHCLGYTEKGKTKRFILGYTEHLQDGDFTKITARRPHVGVYAGPGKLIWITAREVFFEETHANKQGVLDSYSIIGFNYKNESKEGKNRLVFSQGFVAEYSNDKDKRIPFVTLEINGHVRTKNDQSPKEKH